MPDFSLINYSIPTINYIAILNKTNGFNGDATDPNTMYHAYTFTSDTLSFYSNITNSTIDNSYIGYGSLASGAFDPVSENVYILYTASNTAPQNWGTGIIRTNNYRQWNNNFSASVLNSSSAGGPFGATLYHDGTQLIAAIGASVKWKLEGGLSVDNPWNSSSLISGVTSSALWWGINKINNKYYFTGQSDLTLTTASPIIAVSNSSSVNGSYSTNSFSSGSLTNGMANNAQLLNNGNILVVLQFTASAAPYNTTLKAAVSSNNGSTWAQSTIASGATLSSLASSTDESYGYVGQGFANGTFAYAITSNSGGGAIIFTTTDGVTWNANAFNNTFTANGNTLTFFTAVKGRFIGTNSSTTDAFISKDAINWTWDSQGLTYVMEYADLIF